MSPSNIPDRPSALSLAWLFSNVAIAVLSHAITYPFRTLRAPSFRNDILHAAIRTLLHHLTIPQARYLNASTTQRYLVFCKAQGCTPCSVEVERGTGKVAAHWIGDPEADRVILYFHGGAYIQPATQGTFLYLQHLVERLNAGRKARFVSALVLAYSLAPEARYPTQIQEAAAVLAYLLESKVCSPENIFISGDSAGGNLALGLLSHLLHPHPQVQPIPLQQPLGGALLYSPMVSFRIDYPSFERNQSVDMLPASKMRSWAAMFLGKAKPENRETDPGPITGDPYSEPCFNSQSWWQGMHCVVSNVLVMSGGDEIFADPIHQLGHDMKLGWSEAGGSLEDVVFIETPREAHIGPIVDFMITKGDSSRRTSQSVIEEWYKARLGI